ncbi:Guanylate cyclase [Seminavis robusta]|uniref:Guanylate cyclase n=1 Tax=Seminavis robusta TaxID=568900 RepID=A0A9N8F2F4_9STRA|nr:Guanylate cyclase [Seminavis robusta]|eukprot:Sro2830_g338110.1 Guanylate cyclase (344) ;mRNA; r:9948-11203
MLIAKAVVVCWIVYAVQKSRESAEFANQYEAATSKIIESYEGIVHKMGAIGGLGVQLTSQSVEEGTPFPFVSLPHFHLRAQNAKDLSGALAVTINPVVHAHQFQKWDEFVNDPHNNAWIKEISDYQDALGINQFGDDTYDQQRRIVSNRTVDVMRYFNASSMPVPEDGLSESYYLPQWQGSPLAHNGNRVNVNSLRQPQLRDASFWILQHKTAFVGSFLVGKPGTISNPHPVTSLLAFLMSAKQMKEVSYEGDPLSPVHFPIFDSFQMSSRRVVAMMSVYIHWASYLQNILPSISNCSLYVVLENSCQGPASPRQFTYIVQAKSRHIPRFVSGNLVRMMGSGN